MFPILQSKNAPRKSTKTAWYRSPKLIRHGIMLFFFLFLLRVAYHHNVLGGGPNGSPSVEAYCPFGGIESLYQFVTTGGFIRRIEPSALILMGAVVLLTLVASRGFCGWICPFGSIQEWIGMLGKKILRRRFNPTGWWDRALRPLKYVVLAVIIALTWWSGSLVFRDYDPFIAFFHLGDHLEEMKWAYTVLGIVMVGSLFIERFFCKYACPLGAVVGVIGKFGLLRIARDEEGCKECNLCQKRCHAHVEFLPHLKIRDAECNHCLDCVVDCPKPNVLSVRGLEWRFSHATYAGLLLLGFVGLVGIGKVSGNWQTKPEKMILTDASGRLDAGAIRGWMTLEDISKGYGIPLPELYRGVGIQENVPADARINHIGEEHQEGFSPELIRDFVDRRMESPVAPVAIAGVAPGMAAEPPAAKSSPPAQGQPPAAHGSAVRGAGKGQGKGKGNPEAGPREPGKGPNTEHADGQEPEVKGFMTLNEIVLKTGVPKSFLLRQLGLGDDIPGTQPIRSWMHDKGKSVQDLRQAVEDYRAQSKPKQ